MHDDIDQRIRERAYHLWEQEGRPEGREHSHWEEARFLVGIEDNPQAGQLPNPQVEDRAKGWTSPPPPEPIEPIEAIENQGEFPDRFADQGEKSAGPMRHMPPAEPVRDPAEAVAEVPPSAQAPGKGVKSDNSQPAESKTAEGKTGEGKTGKGKPVLRAASAKPGGGSKAR